jgi:hypothetical protein
MQHYQGNPICHNINHPQNETQIDQEEYGERQQYQRTEQEILLIHEVMMMIESLVI